MDRMDGAGATARVAPTGSGKFPRGRVHPLVCLCEHGETPCATFPRGWSGGGGFSRGMDGMDDMDCMDGAYSNSQFTMHNF